MKNITRALLLKVSDHGSGYKLKIKRGFTILKTVYLITRGDINPFVLASKTTSQRPNPSIKKIQSNRYNIFFL